jgi:hypothetical protein
VHLTDVERGKDDTAREAPDDEVQLARKYLDKWKSDRERPVGTVMYVASLSGDGWQMRNRS